MVPPVWPDVRPLATPMRTQALMPTCRAADVGPMADMARAGAPTATAAPTPTRLAKAVTVPSAEPAIPIKTAAFMPTLPDRGAEAMVHAAVPTATVGPTLMPSAKGVAAAIIAARVIQIPTVEPMPIHPVRAEAAASMGAAAATAIVAPMLIPPDKGETVIAEA